MNLLIAQAFFSAGFTETMETDNKNLAMDDFELMGIEFNVPVNFDIKIQVLIQQSISVVRISNNQAFILNNIYHKITSSHAFEKYSCPCPTKNLNGSSSTSHYIISLIMCKPRRDKWVQVYNIMNIFYIFFLMQLISF